jgi:hypothetical protein
MKRLTLAKKSEAMKRLTLHRNSSSFHRFIASSAQLWLYVDPLINGAAQIFHFENVSLTDVGNGLLSTLINCQKYNG